MHFKLFYFKWWYTMNIVKILETIINNTELVDPNDVPNLDLYMDQVTTFMDKHLNASKRFDEDKILTKTMINNYAKNDLLPSPEKKKYSKDHILLLTLIYYLKNVLSISDIKKLLQPISDEYFHSNTDVTLSDIYGELKPFINKVEQATQEDIINKLKLSKESYVDIDTEDTEYLQLFSFIVMLGFDVYLKKQMIEHMVDELASLAAPSDPKKKN